MKAECGSGAARTWAAARARMVMGRVEWVGDLDALPGETSDFIPIVKNGGVGCGAGGPSVRSGVVLHCMIGEGVIFVINVFLK